MLEDVLNGICLVVVLLAIAAASVGCGTGKPIASVDPVLQPYFDSFSLEYKVDVAHINGSFATLNPPYIGYCVITEDKYSITIDPAEWKKLSPNIQEQLLYHELGHCALGLNHIVNLLDNDCPVSIMNPYIMGNDCYNNSSRTYYIQELGSHKH